jgi:hypothetical protein
MRPFVLFWPLCAVAIASTANYTAVAPSSTPDDPGDTVVPTSLNNAGQVAEYEYTPHNVLLPLV